MSMTREQAIEAIGESVFAQHKDALAELMQPCVRLVTGEGLDEPGSTASYFGGSPHLPEGTPWPTWDCSAAAQKELDQLNSQRGDFGNPQWYQQAKARQQARAATTATPLAFLGQINLAEVQSVTGVPHLPKAGLLQFYYDIQQEGWGFDPDDRGSFRVLYFPEGTALQPAQTPADVPDDCRFEPRSVSMQLAWSLPDFISDALEIDMEETESDQDPWDAYHLLKARLGGEADSDQEESHRMGGWPELIQNEMELECQLVSNGIDCGDQEGYQDARVDELSKGAADWKLVLQIATDDEMGWMWGDCGCLYFWAREQESRVGDFDGAWCILQCS